MNRGGSMAERKGDHWWTAREPKEVHRCSTVGSVQTPVWDQGNPKATIRDAHENITGTRRGQYSNPMGTLGYTTLQPCVNPKESRWGSYRNRMQVLLGANGNPMEVLGGPCGNLDESDGNHRETPCDPDEDAMGTMREPCGKLWEPIGDPMRVPYGSYGDCIGSMLESQGNLVVTVWGSMRTVCKPCGNAMLPPLNPRGTRGDPMGTPWEPWVNCRTPWEPP